MTDARYAQQTGKVSETRFSLLEQRVGGMEVAIHDLAKTVRDWMEGRQTNPWRQFGIFVACLIPIGLLLNFYITTAISPVAAVSNQAKTQADANRATLAANDSDIGTLKSQSAASMQDRNDMRIAIAKLLDAQALLMRDFAADHSERQANEREIETQFDADSQLRNVQWATIMRALTGHQNALHELGAVIPEIQDGPFYFPNISNRNHNKPK